ncbi:FUN14 domain-containing protein 1-like [Euwallacea fornicatus]|uniref:FUN14 domain-containing protein 1-like n=1 Tax=Euwallacea fornicatus TaxID=995702 RepID=UPI00338F8841
MAEVVDRAKNFISRFVGDIDKNDATKQILIGAGSGWFSGYLAMRVAKTTAFAVGGGIILLQVASDSGFIKVNWTKVNKNLEKITETVEDGLSIGHNKTWSEKAVDFLKNNTPFTSGFIGGFLIGMAT